VRKMVGEELARIKAAGSQGQTFDRAAQIFEQMSTQDEFAEFLTLPLYEEL
jgi:malate synthase